MNGKAEKGGTQRSGERARLSAQRAKAAVGILLKKFRKKGLNRRETTTGRRGDQTIKVCAWLHGAIRRYFFGDAQQLKTR